MYKKLTIFLFIILVTSANYILADNTPNNKPNYKVHPIKSITGDEKSANIQSDNKVTSAPVLDRYEPFHSASLTYVYTNTGVTSYYDLQSNGVPQEVWQDPLTPGNVHGCFTQSNQEAGWSDRTVVYILSTDFGSTWNILGNVPPASRSGFGAITGTSEGTALIACHTADGATLVRTQVYSDIGVGFGSFVRLDPGVSGVTGEAIWPRVVATANTSLPVKYVLSASVNNTSVDLAYTNTGSDLGPTPGTFSGWLQYPANTAETYSLARSQDGRIGNAYIVGGEPDYGDVAYRSSTDNGLSWSSPQLIWDCNFNTDSLGALRGITMTFLNNVPYVTFETGHLSPPASYVPGLPSQIRLWSPSINGGTPKIVADQNNVPFFPNVTTPDVFFPVSRPSIGRANQGNSLVIAFVSTSANVTADTTNFFKGWMTYSNDAGATWSAPETMTPATPIRDWRYISVSPTNNVTGTGSAASMKVQIIAQSDSVPGSVANGALPSLAQCIGITTNIPVTVGINTISSIVPNTFNLQQNFPNPFNPSTSVRFDISKSSNVTLKVYNAKGQEVATLINNEFVTPGTKEVTFNASALGSGIYFYTLFAGDFKDTKKMMLIK